MSSDESTGADTPSSDEPLERIFNQYMDELAQGKKPDQEAYCKAHPEIADALRGVFKTVGLIASAGRALNTRQLPGGTMLGEFRIIREIGRGGMGIVYEAVQTSLGRRVALKVLPPEVMFTEHALERFNREAHTAGMLHHTNIVPVYAVGQEQDVSFYAMQYIEGRSLSNYLKTFRDDDRRIDAEHFRRAARWGLQIADALAHAHDHGVLHRDVKPANLLRDKNDNIWVFDFGLARSNRHPTITGSSDLVGTLRYMSPEQAAGGKTRLDHRTDIYSLGATLYELTSLCPVFEDDSHASLLNKVLHEEPIQLRRRLPDIPRDLATIINKCMQKERDLRYAHVAEVADDLRRFLSGEAIHARPTPLRVKAKRWIQRHRGLTIGAAAAFVILVATSLFVAKLRQVEGARNLRHAYEAIMLDQDFDRGEELLDRAESLGIHNADLHLYRGLIPMLSQQPAAAIKHFEEAARLEPENLCAWYAIARSKIDIGEFHTGQRLFEKEGERRPDTALGWFLRGYARSRHQPAEAIRCYDLAIEKEPSFAPAILERATYRGVRVVEAGVREDLGPMLNDVDAVVVFRPKASRAYAWRAWAWLAAASYAATQPDLQHRRDEWFGNCRLDIERAQTLGHANDPLVFSIEGAYHRCIGNFAASAQAYARAQQLHQVHWGNTNLAYAHASAVALHALGDLQGALDETEPASLAAPEFYAIGLHHALLLAELGQIDAARAECRRCLETQRTHAPGLYMSAAVMELLGAADEAEAFIRSLGPDDIAILTYEHLPQTEGSREDQPRNPHELEFLAARLTPTEFLEVAGTHPGHRCENTFLVAMRELGAGHRETGLALLRDCLNTQVFFYGEHRFAQVFLERAAADPQWPRWIGRNTP